MCDPSSSDYIYSRMHRGGIIYYCPQWRIALLRTFAHHYDTFIFVFILIVGICKVTFGITILVSMYWIMNKNHGIVSFRFFVSGLGRRLQQLTFSFRLHRVTASAGLDQTIAALFWGTA